MKRIVILFALLICSTLSFAQDNWKYVEASELTLVGKLFPDTPNPYHRIDTGIYGGFDATEFNQVHMSAGIAVAFKTNAAAVSVLADVKKVYGAGSTGPIAQRGFDFYIRKNGKWLWAGQASVKEGETKNKAMIYFMDEGMCDCLVYLPLFTELKSLKIGVLEKYTIKPIDNPFRHRIAVFGSSFTHGFGCSRPAMCYCSQLSRMTGLQFINMGCSGHSKLQDYFARALADADVDAYIFDGFSNPSAEIIEEKLFDFIEIIQAKNPGKPLIFQSTIYREWRNVNTDTDAKELAKREMADQMMKKACKKYKDVYYVTTTNAADANHETTVDGTHPGDYGYTIWANSVREPILKILAKYGIK